MLLSCATIELNISICVIYSFSSPFRYTIFATHIEGLTELATIYPNVKMLHFEVDLRNNRLDFKVTSIAIWSPETSLSNVIIVSVSPKGWTTVRATLWPSFSWGRRSTKLCD